MHKLVWVDFLAAMGLYDLGLSLSDLSQFIVLEGRVYTTSELVPSSALFVLLLFLITSA